MCVKCNIDLSRNFKVLELDTSLGSDFEGVALCLTVSVVSVAVLLILEALTQLFTIYFRQLHKIISFSGLSDTIRMTDNRSYSIMSVCVISYNFDVFVQAQLRP